MDLHLKRHVHTAVNEFLHKIQLKVKVNGHGSHVNMSFVEFQARFSFTKVKYTNNWADFK